MQDKDIGGQLFLSRLLQDHPAQRQKGQQGRVVGQQHGAHQRDKHQGRAHAAGGSEQLQQLPGDHREQAHAAQGAHHRQHTEQTG